jgi:hypothetical protein
MTARTDDYDAIVRVVQLYIDGFNDNDINKFKEAFDEDAWMFYINADGSLYKNLISKSFEGWSTPPSSGVVGRKSYRSPRLVTPPRSSSALTRTSPAGGSTSTICSGSTAYGRSPTSPQRTPAGSVIKNIS